MGSCNSRRIPSPDPCLAVKTPNLIFRGLFRQEKTQSGRRIFRKDGFIPMTEPALLTLFFAIACGRLDRSGQCARNDANSLFPTRSPASVRGWPCITLTATRPVRPPRWTYSPRPSAPPDHGACGRFGGNGRRQHRMRQNNPAQNQGGQGQKQGQDQGQNQSKARLRVRTRPKWGSGPQTQFGSKFGKFRLA